MKSGNRILADQDGWRVEQVTQWATSASYHDQGWCTSTNKGDFDHYADTGKLHVIFRPKDRSTRPGVQVYVAASGRVECRGSGNQSVSVTSLMDVAPRRVREWLESNAVEPERPPRPVSRIEFGANAAVERVERPARVLRPREDEALPTHRLDGVIGYSVEHHTETAHSITGWTSRLPRGSDITLELFERLPREIEQARSAVRFEMPMPDGSALRFSGHVMSPTLTIGPSVGLMVCRVVISISSAIETVDA